MPARMKHPVALMPDAMTAMQSLGKAVAAGGVPEKTLGLVHLRASQINGCSVCLDMHARMMKKDETDERMFTVAAWRDTPYFTDAERVALALTESLTRLSDSSEGVPDAVWHEAAQHYDEKQLATLVLAIAQINVWNRLNIAVRQVAGGAWS